METRTLPMRCPGCQSSNVRYLQTVMENPPLFRALGYPEYPLLQCGACDGSFGASAPQIPPNLVVGRVRRIPIPSRGEDLQVEHPV